MFLIVPGNHRLHRILQVAAVHATILLLCCAALCYCYAVCRHAAAVLHCHLMVACGLKYVSAAAVVAL